MEKGRQRRPPRCRPSRPQAQAESPTTPTSRASFAPRSARPRLRHRSVDAAPGGESDRALNRRALSPRPRVEDPARPGLEPATSRQTSPRTQAGESAALADPDLAGDKKKARRRKAWILFQDESGVSQRPSIRRTWAPKGETPVLIHSFNWSKISISTVLGYRWDGGRSRLFFQTRKGSYNTESLIAFLEDLRRELRGKKVILVWDGLPAHKSRAMQDYLHQQRDWLTVERLPGYAPDLNPVETLWGNIKGQELANRCADDLEELDAAVRSGMARVEDSSKLPFSFLKHANLFF